MDARQLLEGHRGQARAEPSTTDSLAHVQLKSALAGLPLREQREALRPPLPLGTAPAVQRRLEAGAAAPAVQMEEGGDNRPVITKLDAANLQKVVQVLKEAGVWATLVANVKAATQDGKVPLTPALEDEVLLQALIAVESRFQFGAGASLDDMLTDAETRLRIVGAIKKEATPPEKPAAAIPAAGTFGMVTSDTELVLTGGGKLALKAGTAVESKGEQAGQLHVLVHSGQEVEGTIEPGTFLAQPRIATDDDTGKTEDLTYQKYAGELFLGEPSVNDVDQGALGDCFLIAGAGAVAAANPELIKKAVVYNGDETYTVTFQELQKDGRTFAPHQEIVDAYLPTRQGGGANRTAYAQSDQAFDPENQALWPAIIEKAYAQWKGGYTAIQKGGQSAKAMEAITGVRSVRAAMPKEEDVIATFRTWEAEGKAVVCGTRDWMQQTSQKGLLAGAGDGPYRGTLKDGQGNAAEVVKSTVHITDGGDKAKPARDDGKGGFTGAGLASGDITYGTGATSLTWAAGKGPGGPDELEATYRYEGTLDVALNVHGDHAYMFSKVEGETLLFRNPWGPAEHKHPKPLTAGDFQRLFETIGVNAVVPQQKEP